MKNKDRVAEIINDYLDYTQDKTREFERLTINASLYHELLYLLDDSLDNIKNNRLHISILLDTIYGNDTYSNMFYSSIVKSEEQKNDLFIKKFIKLINRDKALLTNTIINLNKSFEHMRFIKNDCNKFLVALKSNAMVSNKICDSINSVLDWAKINYIIDDREHLILKNDINFYNELIRVNQSKNTKNIEYMESQYEKLPDILTMGFDVFEFEINPNKKSILDNIISNMKQDIIKMPNNDIPNYVMEYKDVVNDDNELEYLINGVMNLILNDLIANYSFLLDSSLNYTKINRREIIHDYYELLEKYLVLHEILSNKVNEEENIQEVDIEENIFETDNNEKTLYYALSDVNPLKSKIASDLKKIPKEYYGKIEELLTDYKNGTLPNNKIKKLVNNDNVKAFEIKEDQIRIIFDIIDGNSSAIKGAFIKKANNDNKSYRIISSRSMPEMNPEANKIIEDDLFAILKEEKRDYTR